MASQPTATPAAASDLISFLKALPDSRMRRGILFPQWWKLLVAILANWPGSAWMVELLASGSRDGKPFKARHLFLTSLRTTPEALLRLIRVAPL